MTVLADLLTAKKRFNKKQKPCANCQTLVGFSYTHCKPCLKIVRRASRISCAHCDQIIRFRQTSSNTLGPWLCRVCTRTRFERLSERTLGVCIDCRIPLVNRHTLRCMTCYTILRRVNRANLDEIKAKEAKTPIARRLTPCVTCGALCAVSARNCPSCVLLNRTERLARPVVSRYDSCPECGKQKRGKSKKCSDCSDRDLRKSVVDQRLGRLPPDLAAHKDIFAMWSHWITTDPTYRPCSWLDRSGDALKILAESGPVTDKTLAMLPAGSRIVNTLRWRFTEAGILKEPSLNVDTLMRWVDQKVQVLDSADALLIKEYVRLQLVPIAQRRVKYGERVDLKWRNSQIRIRFIAQVAGQLRNLESSLAKLSQEDFKAIDPPDYAMRIHLRAFTRWLNKRRVGTRSIVFPKITKPQRKTDISVYELRDWVAQASDMATNIKPYERCAILLTVLYAQETTRIAKLQWSQLSDDYKRVRFGDVWIDMPQTLATVFGTLGAERRVGARFVFASRERSDKPLDLVTWNRRLKLLGFSTRKCRGAAIVYALRGVEYPLLARIFGISLTAGAAWALLVDSPSWDQYVAMRYNQDRLQPEFVTIADRVFAEYSGALLKGDLFPSPEIRTARTPLSEADLENGFHIDRVRVI